MANRDHQKALREAEERGWVLQIRRSNHIRLTKPGIRQVVFSSSTPSDRRATLNLVTLLRRLEQEQSQEMETSTTNGTPK